MKPVTIGIIGAGNMGSAFYKGLSKVFPSERLFITDSSKEKLAFVSANNTFENYQQMLPHVQIVIFAIKPQSFSTLTKEQLSLFSSKMVISIMAGVSLKTLTKKTGATKIIRSMPNLPVQVQKGIIGWIANKNISQKDKILVEKIFSPLGESIELKKEKAIDAITALSGSGPAYFFYLTEMLAKKACQWGFDKNTADTIAKKTLEGAAQLLLTNQTDSENLRKAVTSKGGTTEAAINYLMKHRFATIFSRALEKAQKRSLELQK